MIAIERLHSFFDLISDKVGSPYFTSSQKDTFFQQAVTHFINQYFKNPSSHVMEDTHIDLEDVHTLVTQVNTRTDVNGNVNFSDINSSLPDGKEWMYFLACGRGSSLECKGEKYKSRWVRHNDYYVQKRNAFKKPEVTKPIHRYFNDYLKFEPKGETSVEIVILMRPNEVTLDDPNDSYQRGPNAVDLDLPDKVFNEIVYLALTQAGINLRENEFYAAVEREVGKNV